MFRPRWLTGQLQIVRHPPPDRHVSHGIVAPLPARIGHGDQVTGEIAAVDGRHVHRVKWTKVACVVPIEEMALEPPKLDHRGKGQFEPFNSLDGPCPAEVARGDGGQEIQADIRR